MDPSSDFPPPARSVDEKDEYYDKTDLHVDVDVAEVDTGAQLVAGKAALDPYEAQRIKYVNGSPPHRVCLTQQKEKDRSSSSASYVP